MSELGKLVQEQHAPVTFGYLAGLQIPAATHQPSEWIIVESAGSWVVALP